MSMFGKKPVRINGTIPPEINEIAEKLIKKGIYTNMSDLLSDALRTLFESKGLYDEKLEEEE